ncbi:SulP family inorganic anion transporter [uncultured Cytophaga sp.]|uniref:SulP family inorganic anion transporter n=1 Tax=uncultured Cytophaga sp. TaxID=160238 RepID=UPI002637BF44|nr:SulP family inorganic anion transporter [uncultured Cytophaga sp.]
MLSIKETLQNIQSGVVVFLVALPLCLGIAIAQDAPPIAGIISGIIGGSVVMLFSGSKYSISGPAAGLTAIVLTAVNDLGSFEALLTAMIVAGAIQVVLGIIKAGIVGYYFPSSVIKGMLSAIGIILIIKQIPHLVGYDLDPEGDMAFWQMDGRNSFSELLNMLNFFTPGPAIVSGISIIVMIFWSPKFIHPDGKLSFIPNALVIVLLGIILNSIFEYFFPNLFIQQDHLVALPTINSTSDLYNSLRFPDLSGFSNSKTYVVGFTIAIVASLESLLSLDASDKLKKVLKPSSPNRELIAQGLGNLACSAVGGIPVTSVIVRSSANIAAGASNKLSGYVHGFLLLVSVLVFPDVLTRIPNASLAVILLFTGYKLTKLSLIKSMFSLGINQYLPFLTTIIVMLLTDMLKGIVCGLIVAIYFILRDLMRIPIKVSNTVIEGKTHTLITFPETVSFINKGVLLKMLDTIPANSYLILDGKNIKSIDYDVLETIHLFMDAAAEKNIEIDAINIQIIDKLVSSH